MMRNIQTSGVVYENYIEIGNQYAWSIVNAQTFVHPRNHAKKESFKNQYAATCRFKVHKSEIET